MNPYIAIKNGIVYTGDEVFTDKVILIAGDVITDLVNEDDVPAHAEVVDAGGANIAPGLVDLQIYGADGYLFSANPTAEAIAKISRAILKSGTTSFMLTLATNAMDIFDAAMQTAAQNPHPALLGLHLEGPYLNAEKRGAHPLEYIKKPTEAEIRSLLEKGRDCLRMMTIAPEVFDRDTIQLLLDSGILLSAGHSNATMEQALEAFASGIRAGTHLFNAMSPFHHREPGLPGAVFKHETVSASIIADGIHVHYETLSISKQLMKDRLFLITDAVTHVDTGPYQHVFTGDRYTLPDGTLSGSSLTLLQAVANCVKNAGIPLDEALRMASYYPSRLIGAKDLGNIKPGSKANLILFDEDFQIRKVMLQGIWQS